MKYAKKTKVPIDRSKAEIEKTLMRYGASEFAYATKPTVSVVIFRVNEKRVRFNLPLPAQKEFSSEVVYAQACRAQWRALVLIIKAKLEAVESGITVFEEEFLAHLVTAGGQTVGERILPELAESLKKGASTLLLPGA